MKKILLKTLLLIIALSSILFVLTGCNSSKSYIKVVDKYYEAQSKADTNMLIEVFPKFMGAERYYDDDYMEGRIEYLEEKLGENIKFTYEITNTEKYDKDKLSELQEHIKKVYKEDVKVKEAYELKLKTTITGNDSSETEDEQLLVLKIDGKWYLLF